MWIAVYAPHNLSGKIALWSFMANLIDNLDRILVALGDFNEVREVEERFGLVWEKGSLDHHHILFKEHAVDFGHIPFLFFHSWLELDGFHKLVVDTCNNDGIVEVNGLISFKKKATKP
nr:RNA-directed DNA polymerase, eukaryota, reverse transcriptase zinc-binding domain protein [Tanacetum cinerariifolium]